MNVLSVPSDFQKTMDFVLPHEGGLEDNPADPGGITKYGISLRSYPELGREGIINLTVEQAKAIYKKDWWDKYGYHALMWPICAKVMDMAIDMGPGGAGKLLQKSCRSCGSVGLVVDGDVGPKTILAANTRDPKCLMTMLCHYSCTYYEYVAKENPEEKIFLDGWLRRANDVPL